MSAKGCFILPSLKQREGVSERERSTETRPGDSISISVTTGLGVPELRVHLQQVLTNLESTSQQKMDSTSTPPKRPSSTASPSMRRAVQHTSHWSGTPGFMRARLGRSTTGYSRRQTLCRPSTTETCSTFTAQARSGTRACTCIGRGSSAGPLVYILEFGACGGTWLGGRGGQCYGGLEELGLPARRTTKTP